MGNTSLEGSCCRCKEAIRAARRRAAERKRKRARTDMDPATEASAATAHASGGASSTTGTATTTIRDAHADAAQDASMEGDAGPGSAPADDRAYEKDEAMSPTEEVSQRTLPDEVAVNVKLPDGTVMPVRALTVTKVEAGEIFDGDGRDIQDHEDPKGGE